MNKIIAKNLAQALQIADYEFVAEIKENNDSYTLSLKSPANSIEMSFDKKENGDYVAAKLVDAVHYYSVKWNYPQELIQYKQNSKIVKNWEFTPNRVNNFLKTYQNVIRYGLQVEDVLQMPKNDLEQIMIRIFKRKITVHE
jgi:hypothetical protein